MCQREMGTDVLQFVFVGEDGEGYPLMVRCFANGEASNHGRQLPPDASGPAYGRRLSARV
jgi:hypothetical protein